MDLGKNTQGKNGKNQRQDAGIRRESRMREGGVDAGR
jgi:hypothetical protein